MGVQSKLPRVKDKRLVKHAPPRVYHQNEGSHVVYVKSSTPFVSAIKRIERCLDGFRPVPNRRGKYVAKSGKHIKYIEVKGMGWAMSKVMNLGLHFKYEKQLKVEVYTKTIGVFDEFVGSDDETFQKRNVSSVELHIMI
ncbi:hypothetical protein FOA43_003439 [Brettanomyces nanus]|uniref:Uncharacterized protein n=1 Tax=Eeniella nana TaxID=13502 RepID=A0A875S555_EENNA|nr:uncharacterized protein FOA43_003439 [Brettanomyces nanus]QPG76053.1 hypothetical protein FOA43_003439 [Brettanomyces nanus]